MIGDVLKIGGLLVAIGIAWGTLKAEGDNRQNQIDALKQSQLITTEIQAQQADLRVQAARTEAKSAQAAEQAKQNHDLLLQLLQRLGQ